MQLKEKYLVLGTIVIITCWGVFLFGGNITGFENSSDDNIVQDAKEGQRI